MNNNADTGKIVAAPTTFFQTIQQQQQLGAGAAASSSAQVAAAAGQTAATLQPGCELDVKRSLAVLAHSRRTRWFQVGIFTVIDKLN